LSTLLSITDASNQETSTLITVTDLESNPLQNDFFARIKSKYPKSLIETQFQNLFKLNTLNLILEKVSGLVTTIGWYPFLTGIINLESFSKSFVSNVDECLRAIDKAIATVNLDKYPNIRTALIRYNRMGNLDLRLSPIAISNSLKNLSNPTLLKRIVGHIKADILDLLELQKNGGIANTWIYKHTQFSRSILHGFGAIYACKCTLQRGSLP
jgi:hypothetical protein